MDIHRVIVCTYRIRNQSTALIPERKIIKSIVIMNFVFSKQNLDRLFVKNKEIFTIQYFEYKINSIRIPENSRRVAHIDLNSRTGLASVKRPFSITNIT